jgi:hypothetical membrane protein
MLCTGIAIGLFPGPFSPMMHWLSDLGNVKYNPSGATFFNIGCVLTSMMLAVFYSGFGFWNLGSKIRNILLVICKGIGYFDAISVALLGIFSEITPEHNFIAFMYFYGNMAMMIATSIALLFHTRSFKPIPIYGFLVAGASIVFLVLPVSPQIFEWIIVIASLVFTTLLVANTIHSARHSSPIPAGMENMENVPRIESRSRRP